MIIESKLWNMFLGYSVYMIIIVGLDRNFVGNFAMDIPGNMEGCIFLIFPIAHDDFESVVRLSDVSVSWFSPK